MKRVFYASERSRLINNSRDFFSNDGDCPIQIGVRNEITMKYDKFWIYGFLLVIAVWLLVLGSTLRYLIVPTNVLVNRDIDLSVPTLFMMVLIVLYLCLGIFIYIVYLLKIGEIKRKHMKTISRKVTGDYKCSILHWKSIARCDKCSIIIPARDEES